MQTDFFEDTVFETRSASDTYDFDLFRSRVKRGMSEAIRKQSLDRNTLASEIARLIGQGSFSKSTLDALTSESKISHNIRLDQFKAFVIATGERSLWDNVVSDEGLLVIEGNEARLAEIGLLQEKQREISRRLKSLRAVPVMTERGLK